MFVCDSQVPSYKNYAHFTVRSLGSGWAFVQKTTYVIFSCRN